MFGANAPTAPTRLSPEHVWRARGVIRGLPVRMFRVILVGMSSGDQDTAVSDVGHELPAPTASDCLVIVHQRNGGAGRCLKLGEAPLRIGRDPNNEVVLTDDDGVSRRHARIERRDGRVLLMDVGSTNGTLLNDVELTTIAELRSGDRIKVGATIFKYLSSLDLEAALFEQIFNSTITDELTGLYNKRYLNDELAREFSRARRHGRSLSLLVIDIDHFKDVNDTHGHQVGDMTLRAVGHAVTSCVRGGDIAARYGGEEIVVVLPETRLEQAVLTAERLRRVIAEQVVTFREARVQVSVSVGCAEQSATDEDEHRLFDRADQRLYAAKSAGRNSVKW